MPSPLPPSLSDALRPVLPTLAQDTVQAIGHEVPDYARPLEGPFGRALRLGVEHALARFVDQLAEPGTDPRDVRGAYLELGRGEHRAGRSLDALLGAYRLGARLAWERFQQAAVQAGHPPEVVYALAGAIFTYIDAISAESAAGYAEEQSRAEGERGRRRRALIRALGDGEAGAEELGELAAAAGWALPPVLAALVLPAGRDPEAAERLASRVDPEAIAAVQGELVLAWLPDPLAPGRRAQLEALLAGQDAALGPAVPPARAAESRDRAAAALFALPGRGLVLADEHLLDLLLLAPGQRPVLADLAEVLLAPLADAPPGQRDKLAATLRAWLDHPGQVQHVAGLLGVHPQTVRYRLAGLRERFGEAVLDDPEARFALGLALRGRTLLDGEHPGYRPGP